MKKPAAGTQGTQPIASRKKAGPAENGKIHPVLIYPFKQPGDYSDLEELYQLVARLNEERGKYARPITVMDRKTHYAMEGNKGCLLAYPWRL